MICDDCPLNLRTCKIFLNPRRAPVWLVERCRTAGPGGWADFALRTAAPSDDPGTARRSRVQGGRDG